ncbi:MAG: DUF58 domain-containing protein [Anaerolineae bacterium]|nr:DUF58 domain-containing protein [Anaerolineae bacterium]
MTVSLRVVLVLLALSLAALAVTGQSVFARLSYLWGLVVAASWLWSLLALRKMTVERRARTHRAEVGQIFEERFWIQNGGRLPRLWVAVQDHSNLPASQGSRVLTMIGGRQGRSYLARTRLVLRGVFPLGPTELSAADPLGLFPVSHTVSPENSLLVYPMMVDVRTFPSPAGLMPGGEAIRRRTHQVTPNAASVREYAPGDPLNRIHWASTARRDRLMVKEFELDPLAEVWIFVDASRTAQFALPHELPTQVADALWHPSAKVALPPSTEEYAVSIAASLARHFLGRGRAVGMVSWGQSFQILPPDRGSRQLGKMLEALALLRAEGELPLSALVTAQAEHLPRGSTAVVVTPSVDDDVPLAVDLLIRRGLRPVVVLLDAASFGGPEGTAAQVAAVRALGVPVCHVPQGVDLSASLCTLAV